MCSSPLEQHWKLETIFGGNIGCFELRPPVLLARRNLHKDLAAVLALQLRFLRACESMGNHDSKIVDAGSVD
jgi:hypothetical protein